MIITIAPDILERRRSLMIAALADWTETADPCERGHVEHGAQDHVGRHGVHSISRSGFGADWDYDAAVEFIQAAVNIDGSIDTPRPRSGHIFAMAPDGTLIAFECRP